ncbi:serine dehydratase subunit alpha family protein [Murimonas intestini]|uniref:L-cysteine desulfidase family protein n=1 Tax=Murimonas intestini TaxID=1337051 RepID=UPI0011DE2D02|nr:L-serine ammonia-lyase, iron-sulfur-dependent, subunit alpha [Murimonas intestini]
MSNKMYENFTEVLKHELVPALGCTEPIAIAFTAAKAREVLGHMPEKMKVSCSGNIVKNVKSVTVPSTDGLKGIASSAIAGAVNGDSSLEYEVLKPITRENVETVRHFLEEGMCEVGLLDTEAVLDIEVRMSAGNDSVVVEVKDEHTHIDHIEKNGEIIYQAKSEAAAENAVMLDPDTTLPDILWYADHVDLNDVKDIIEEQINKNLMIAEEGLRRPYGANVGKNIMKTCRDCTDKAVAYAAAGSDARMDGCKLPVVINSGSGNQGLTVSMPVYIFAEEYNVSHEKMLRAVVFSNMTAIYQKSKLGKLSAYCGAVSAACASGAAITYMLGGTYEQIENTLTNAIATLSGIVCDGAKASCAAKIATAVDSAILAHKMAMSGDVLKSGEGLIADTLQETIEAYTTMGRDGMRETDRMILKMMTS